MRQQSGKCEERQLARLLERERERGVTEGEKQDREAMKVNEAADKLMRVYI